MRLDESGRASISIANASDEVEMIEDDKIPQGSSVTEKEPRMFKALGPRPKTPAGTWTPP